VTSILAALATYLNMVLANSASIIAMLETHEVEKTL